MTILDELAAKWDAAIGQKFGLDLKAHHDVIKYYDNIMLKAEKKRLYQMILASGRDGRVP